MMIKQQPTRLSLPSGGDSLPHRKELGVGNEAPSTVDVRDVGLEKMAV
jgi:hypothetical protein